MSWLLSGSPERYTAFPENPLSVRVLRSRSAGWPLVVFASNANGPIKPESRISDHAFIENRCAAYTMCPCHFRVLYIRWPTNTNLIYIISPDRSDASPSGSDLYIRWPQNINLIYIISPDRSGAGPSESDLYIRIHCFGRSYIRFTYRRVVLTGSETPRGQSAGSFLIIFVYNPILFPQFLYTFSSKDTSGISGRR